MQISWIWSREGWADSLAGEYGHVCAWPLATAPKPRSCLCADCESLCGARCADTTHQGSISAEPHRYV